MKSLLILFLTLSVVFTQKVAPKPTPKADDCVIPRPGPDVISLTDEKVQEEQMYKIIPAWKGKKLTRKDLSGAGGAKLFMYNPVDENVSPFGAVLKISPPSSDKKKEDIPLDKRIVGAVSCALYKNNKTTVINMAEGSNWFIQESAGYEGHIWNMQYPSKLVGDLLARVHMTPTTWAEKFYPEIYKLVPGSEKWAKNTVGWWNARNPLDAASVPMVKSLVDLELSCKWKYPKISTKLVTTHNDFHDYNFLYANKKEDLLRVIDLDTNWVGNPLADISRNIWTMNLNWKQRKDLFQTYMEKMTGGKVTKDDMIAFMFDAEFYKVLTPIEGFTSRVFACPDVQKDPKIGIDSIKELKSIWDKAGKNKQSMEKLVKEGLFKYALSASKRWNDLATKTACGLSIASIQSDFRVKEDFHHTFQLRGKGGHRTNLKRVELLFSKFNEIFSGDVMKQQYKPVVPWTEYPKKGGIIATKKNYETLPEFYGPLEKKGRRFVFGSTRKSGYPYALWTGWLNFKISQQDNKARVSIKTKNWHQMALGAPDMHQAWGDFMDGFTKSFRAVWNAELVHPNFTK